MASGGSISWAYNWAGSLSGLLPSGVEFVPMLWGHGDELDTRGKQAREGAGPVVGP
jgi:hypothetical protein